VFEFAGEVFALFLEHLRQAARLFADAKQRDETPFIKARKFFKVGAIFARN
jgi:hypothetical protein